LCRTAVLEIGHPLDIEIDKVLIEDRNRQVRAGIERPAIVDGVKRVQPDETRAKITRHPLDDDIEVAEIAASPIAPRAHTVEAHTDTSRTPSPHEVRIDVRTFRCHDVARARLGCAHLHCELVISEFGDRVELGTESYDGSPADLARRDGQ